jgi:hypothetical protein
MKELYFIVAKNNLNVQPTSAFSDTPTPVLIEKKGKKTPFQLLIQSEHQAPNISNTGVSDKSLIRSNRASQFKQTFGLILPIILSFQRNVLLSFS